MTDIRAVVADIDGTITDDKRHVSLAAVEAIRKLPIPVVLASGNIICFMRAASKLIGASDIMIGENGGVILAGYDGKAMVLADIEECRKARDLLLKHFPHAEPLDETYRKSELAFRRNFDIEEAKAVIAKGYPGLEMLDTKFAYHLKHREVNKGTGLRKVAEIMGLKPENFAALGDSENDAPMLEAAGIGIAVANASPELKAIADHVTIKSYGEGAAEGLEWLSKKLIR